MPRIVLSLILILAPLCQVRGQILGPILAGGASGGGDGAPTVNVTWTYSGSGTTLTVAPTAGHFFWVGICAISTPSTPTDNASSTYVPDSSVSNLGYICKSFHLASAGSGITTVTVGVVTGWVFAADVSGLASGAADVSSTTFTTGGGSFNGDAQTTTVATEIAFGFGYSNDGAITTTCAAGWTTLYATSTTHALCTKALSATTSLTWSGTTTAGNLWDGQMQTYK